MSSEAVIRQAVAQLYNEGAHCIVLRTGEDLAERFEVTPAEAEAWLNQNDGWITEWLGEQLDECIWNNCELPKKGEADDFLQS